MTMVGENAQVREYDFSRGRMKRFVDGVDRGQSTLFPECLEEWINEDNPVRVVDVFVDELDLAQLGFVGVDPKATGRPSYQEPHELDEIVIGMRSILASMALPLTMISASTT